MINTKTEALCFQAEHPHEEGELPSSIRWRSPVLLVAAGPMTWQAWQAGTDVAPTPLDEGRGEGEGRGGA